MLLMLKMLSPIVSIVLIVIDNRTANSGYYRPELSVQSILSAIGLTASTAMTLIVSEISAKATDSYRR